MERHVPWLWSLLVALAAVSGWCHIATAKELVAVQSQLAAERAARQSAGQQVRESIEGMAKTFSAELERTNSSVAAVTQHANTAAGQTRRNGAVLDLMYVVSEAPDGTVLAISPRDDSAAIGLRR